jgi:hypothetical protein
MCVLTRKDSLERLHPTLGVQNQLSEDLDLILQLNDSVLNDLVLRAKLRLRLQRFRA